MAVITDFKALRESITAGEVQAGLADGSILQSCEVAAEATCRPAADLVGAVVGTAGALAMVPASLVQPQVKVLPIDGADPFGNAEARGAPYPFVETLDTLPDGWQPWDGTAVRTLMSVGESCPDRGVAYQAITLGKGWDYVFGGGTAVYNSIYPNPVGPGEVGDGFNIVDATDTGNDGLVWDTIRAADITVEDFECPVTNNWGVNDGVVFSIDPRTLTYMADGGTDIVTLAANHVHDQGQPGFLETLQHFRDAGIAYAGVGKNLDEALTPAVYDANGLSFAVVGWNWVPGPIEATPDQPGVAWMTEENVRESVRRASEAADVVICMPQWGYLEYRFELSREERDIAAVMLDAGCDQILGNGAHWAGEIDIAPGADGPNATILSHGNFLFGQSWAQESQEGMLVEMAFVGTRLAQVRVHPYIMLNQARAAFVDYATDGSYLLNRVFNVSRIEH
ncbi:MAG: CapA family protein [Chloroflexota bacterium]